MVAKGCGGTNRAGEPCGHSAGWGTDHLGFGNCKNHGGSSPNGRKHAERQEVEETAGKAIAKLGLPRTVDPATALLEEVYRSAGAVAFYESVVAGLPEDQVPDSPWLRLYNDERKHMAMVARSTVDAKIAERHVKVVEVVGGQLAVFARKLTMALGHDPDDPSVREVVSTQFRALSA